MTMKPRRNDGRNRTAQIRARVVPEVLEELDRVARRRGVTKSALVRDAILEIVAEEAAHKMQTAKET